MRKNLGFNFPINPDALIIRDLVWILLESKHSCTNKDILEFEPEGPVLTWVLHAGESGPNNTFVGPFSTTALTESNVARLIRSGLSSEQVA